MKRKLTLAELDNRLRRIEDFLFPPDGTGRSATHNGQPVVLQLSSLQLKLEEMAKRIQALDGRPARYARAASFRNKLDGATPKKKIKSRNKISAKAAASF